MLSFPCRIGVCGLDNPKKKRLLFIGVVLISLELWNSIFSGGELGILFPFSAHCLAVA